MDAQSDKTCWYKTIGGEWKTGFFRKWSTYYEEFESGPGPYPAAIVEDAVDSQVHMVFAGFVSFSPDHPDHPEPLPTEEEVAATEAQDILWKSTLAEWMAMKNNWYVLPELKAEKPARFKPRLRLFYPFVAVQVHPEAIEVFSQEYEYLCQVQWVDSRIVSPQGGLPLIALVDMFKEANE
jgi:hypothetical protein